jgi:hypothetical protein
MSKSKQSKLIALTVVMSGCEERWRLWTVCEEMKHHKHHPYREC